VSSENKYTFWLYFLRNNYEDVNKREWVVVIKQNNRLKGLKFIVWEDKGIKYILIE